MAEKSVDGPRSKASQDPFRTYEEWFVASPDPWLEIIKLDHGTDRTFGTTVRSMVMNAEPDQRPAMEKRLLQALANAAITDVGRTFVCRQLALVGSVACVPAVAALLRDPRTVDAARYALDGIDDPAVDAAYRASLDALKDRAKAGLIGSIAMRRDAQAIPALQTIAAKASEPAEVRTAATRALERLNGKA